MKIPLNPDGYPKILQLAKAAGFVTFEDQNFDMNIIGERNPNGEADKFDDWIHVCFLENDQWQWHALNVQLIRVFTI